MQMYCNRQRCLLYLLANKFTKNRFLMHISEIVEEIDISQLITESGDDFIINLNATLTQAMSSKEILIRNGIVILLCKANGGSIIIDSKEYMIPQSSVIVLPSNHIISNINSLLIEQSNAIAISEDYILNMPSPIDTNIFSYSRCMSVIKIADDKFEDLLSYYQFIYKESKESSKYRMEIIRSIFFALILEIIAEYEKVFNTIDQPSNIKANNLSDRFFRLLATNYKTNRTVKFYADKLNLTPKYLSTAIKRATGRPILVWIHEAILIEAKMLLRTTDMTVQQIADQLNFSSPSAFVQFIKKHTGKTPRNLQQP